MEGEAVRHRREMVGIVAPVPVLAQNLASDVVREVSRRDAVHVERLGHPWLHERIQRIAARCSRWQLLLRLGHRRHLLPPEEHRACDLAIAASALGTVLVILRHGILDDLEDVLDIDDAPSYYIFIDRIYSIFHLQL